MDKRNLRPMARTALVILVVFLVSPIQLAQAGTDTIYAATNNGVFKSTDGAASWFPANAGISGHTFSLVVDPGNPEILYAGTLGYGVFRTTDGGATWSPAGLAKTIISTLALDPTDSNTIYAGTAGSMYFSGTVFKSTDSGGNWAVADAGLPGAIVKVLTTDSANPPALYAGTNWVGVFKTTNGAGDWTPANAGLMNTYVSALAVDPADPMTVYVGLGGCSFNCARPAGVFKSTDKGTSWTRFTGGLTDLQVISLAVDPTDTRILYAGTRLHGLFKSVDGGVWTSINPNLSPTLLAINHFPLIADPVIAGRVYVGTTDGIFKSNDGGINWIGSNDGFPAETKIFALAVEPPSAPTIDSVISEIEELNVGSEVRSTLISQLNAAQAAADRGSLREARNQLQAVITQVGALRESGDLDPLTADSIITSTQAIIEDLAFASKPRVRSDEEARHASP